MYDSFTVVLLHIEYVYILTDFIIFTDCFYDKVFKPCDH